MEENESFEPLIGDDISPSHKTADWLKQHNGPHHRIHTTGGASAPCLKEIITQCKPAPIPDGVQPPYCECGVHCQLVHDHADLPDGTVIPVRVWVCSIYKCFFFDNLDSYNQPSHVANIYSKQFLDLDERLGTKYFDGIYATDRYITLWDIMGSWGTSFADSFFKKLDNLRERAMAVTGDREVVVYPEGSKAMPAGNEYDAFCSYRWQTGRTSLHLTFCSVFTMPIVLFVMAVVYPILSVIFYFAVTRNIPYGKEIWDGDPKTFDESSHMMALGWCIKYMCSWYWFEILGSIFIILILMFGAQIVSDQRDIL